MPPEFAPPDLTLPKLPYGTHQVPWDLRVLLYVGAAGHRRDKAIELIAAGALGTPVQARLPFVRKVHEIASAKIALGRSPATVISQLEATFLFYTWADDHKIVLNDTTAAASFSEWVDYWLHRIRVAKDATLEGAFPSIKRTADMVNRALGSLSKNPAKDLLRQTRITRPKHYKGTTSGSASKQNLQETFQFGNFLADICTSLDVAAIREPLPLVLTVLDDRKCVIAGGLKKGLDAEYARINYRPGNLPPLRAPVAQGESLVQRRSALLNLRIEAEMLIFIAQTGMNLAPAARLRRENYRWKTEGEDLLAFRVFKGRRSGEAIFRCFKAYREHFRRYITWLEETGLGELDNRLFPFIYPGKIPAAHALPAFKSVQTHSAAIGVRHFRPRALRRTRVNWLLRLSRNIDLTAEQAAHSKEVLLRVYDEPNHHAAAIEVTRFHQATDPTFSPPGPGLCVSSSREPAPISGTPSDTPRPDCISPDGCLFCVFHRDVMTADYCWKLATHRHLKMLESSLYKPPKGEQVHPANLVCDRITLKLNAIADGSEVRSMWVRDATDSIRAGRYHPLWRGHINLIEVFA